MGRLHGGLGGRVGADGGHCAPMVILRAVLACLYDVHGNLPALEAVLEDARGAGADRYLLGGDYALFGGWPEETVARLRGLERARWIRGNGERWTARPGDAPDDDIVQGAIAACRGGARARTSSTTSPSLPEDTFIDAHPLLPRLAGQRRALVLPRARATTRPSCSPTSMSRGSSSGTPICRSGA